jgi:hypothetical protein
MLKMLAIFIVIILVILIVVLGPTVFIEKFKIDAWKDE